MTLILVGLNHKTATIEIREQFFLQPLERNLILSELKNNPNVIEAFILSTCNRTEIYAHMLDNRPEFLWDVLFQVKKMTCSQEFQKHFYVIKDAGVVTHLFEVACGLDSLVIGEKQILGQVNEAFELSRGNAMMGKTFNILSNLVLQAAKKVQHETQIGRGGSSISWAAVAMAEQALGTLQDKSVLILGAGKMGSLAANYLHKKFIKNLFVMNRTPKKAQTLIKQVGGTTVPFWQIKEILSDVDVCICSAGAPHYLIEEELVREVMSSRKNQKLVFVDISVPRNINPSVAGIEGVRLAAIDELEKVVKYNLEKRSQAQGQVVDILDKKIKAFYDKMAKIQALDFAHEQCSHANLP